jgi:hypothetical protein
LPQNLQNMTQYLKFAIIIALSLLQTRATAQTVQLFYVNPNDTVFVFGDKINIREKPASDAKSVTQLNIGEMLIVTEITETQTTLNNLKMPWYKVRFKGQQTGYVWGGLISVTGLQKVGDVQFVTGIVKQNTVTQTDESLTDYQVEMRAIKGGAIVHKVNTKITGSGYFHPMETEIGARGLKGYKAILGVTLSFDACGYPWNDWQVLWDGKQLSSLPVCVSVADGGVFSHTERYVFPQPLNDYETGHFGDESLLFFAIEHNEREEQEDGSWDENSWVRARLMKKVGDNWVKPKNMNEPKQ